MSGNFRSCHFSFNTTNTGATTTIPIGIAVGRQRMQETTSLTTTVPQIQSKDLNRFSMGLDLGEKEVFYNHHSNFAHKLGRITKL